MSKKPSILDVGDGCGGMELRRYTAEKINLEASRSIGRARLAAISRANLASYEEASTGALVLQLSTYVHGMTKERIVYQRSWPVTWWDHFKERWFPGWALARWPAKYDRVHIDEPKFLAVCPHLQDDERNRHLEWMVSRYDEG